MLSVVSSEKEFAEIENIWMNLYKISTNKTPFQSFSFVFSSWKYFLNFNSKNKLHIILFKKNHQSILDCVLPSYIDSQGVLRFINDSHIDFSDILLSDFNLINDFTTELCKHINQDKLIKGVKFSNFSNKSIFLSSLGHFLTNSFIYSNTVHSFLPSINFNTIEEADYLKSKQRNEFKKIFLMYRSFTFKILNFCNSSFPVKELKYISELMVKKGYRDKDFFNDSFLKLSENLYNNNILNVALLFKGDTPVAVTLLLCDSNYRWCLFWISMYDNEFKLVNIALYNNVINVFKDDYFLNFGRGGYDYKIKNYNPNIGTIYSLLWGKSLFFKFKMMLNFNLFYIKSIIKKYLNK